MSKYTTEVRYICEHFAELDDSVGYESVNSVISKSRASIFDFEYPMFDNAYKSVLETKILKHYYTREIGEETYGLWKLRLDSRLNEIMPYYNQLYKSTLLNFDPLSNVDLTKDKDITNKGENETNTNGNTRHTGTIGDVGHLTGSSNTTHNETEDHWQMYSDTPQGGLNGVRGETYLTNVTHDTDSYTGTVADTHDSKTTDNTRTFNDNINRDNNTEGNFTTTEDYLEHVRGLNGNRSFSELLMQYRETFINIDMLIIDELSDLFINLW